jgi:hypothetical protein
VHSVCFFSVFFFVLLGLGFAVPSVQEARLFFEVLNEWAPLEAEIGKVEKEVEDWYRGSFVRMTENGRLFTRKPATNGETCKYLWADWGEKRFSETSKPFEPRTHAEAAKGEKEWLFALSHRSRRFLRNSSASASVDPFLTRFISFETDLPLAPL